MLINLNINEQINKTFSRFGRELLEPILHIVHKRLELNFTLPQFNIKCNLLEYIICCKKLNTNYLYLKKRKRGRKHCEMLNTIIQSKKFK